MTWPSDRRSLDRKTKAKNCRLMVSRQIESRPASEGLIEPQPRNRPTSRSSRHATRWRLDVFRRLHVGSCSRVRLTLVVRRLSGTPMKRTKFLLLVTLCAITLCAFAVVCMKEPRLGGYTNAPVTDHDVIQAAEFAINAQSKTIQQLGDQQLSKLQLLTILRAEQQVVAGTNYRLTLSVMADGDHQRTAEANVWWQAWRANPYELTSWTWK